MTLVAVRGTCPPFARRSVRSTMLIFLICAFSLLAGFILIAKLAHSIFAP
jgi:general stress protein CsbA